MHSCQKVAMDVTVSSELMYTDTKESQLPTGAEEDTCLLTELQLELERARASREFSQFQVGWLEEDCASAVAVVPLLA